MRVGIVGGGVAGLLAGYRLAEAGQEVLVFEKEAELGGLARSLQMDAGYVERCYHFICLNDRPLLDLVEELGLSGRLHWANTKMGQFFNGTLYPFSTLWDLLAFRPFNLLERFRFGLRMMTVKIGGRNDWQALENLTAQEWLEREFGARAFQVIYRPLIELKFGPYAERLSAAWIWARFHRLGRSRSRLTQREKLGYLEGGTHALIHRLSDGIRAKGGKILTGAGVEKIAVKDGRACGVVSGAGSHEADAVVATVPFVTLLRLIDHERAPYFDLLRTVEYIGVVCVLLRLKARFTHFFWTNINEPGIPLAGIVEYTNLNPCPFLKGSHLLYLPMYLPHSSPRYTLDDQELVRQCAGYLHAIRPDFDSGWIEDSHVFRSKYAQPICPLGFRKLIAPVQSPVPNLFVTDSSQLHPHDRTIANSIELGQRAAALVLRGRTTRAASPSSPA